MATLEEHCRDCQAELGESFAYVHKWLDELQEEYGPMHRPFRHNTDGVAQIRRRWGKKAARAAEIHIRRDTGGCIPTPRELRDYWGIRIEEIEPDRD